MNYLFYRILCLITTLILSILPLFSQDIQYARKIIEQLASPELHGRGYTENGDKKAAKFIVSELKRMNLKKIKDSYFQHFSVSVNTFSESPMLKINNVTIEAGTDFLASSSSPACKGKYELIWLNEEITNNCYELNKLAKYNLNSSIIVIDTAGVANEEFHKAAKLIIDVNPLQAKAIIQISDKKLLFAPSTKTKNFPFFQIKRQAFPDSAKFAEYKVRTKFHENYKTQNVVAYIEGEIDSFLVFTAHYDHLGRIDKNLYFPGANDNASGVATLLNLAKHFSELKTKPRYNLAFLFFSAEEIGLLGSKFFVENPLFPLSRIKFLINLDMVGTGDKGISVVNGTEHQGYFNKMKEINDTNAFLSEISIRGVSANSDHHSFHLKKVPCFFIYTLGDYMEYHNIYDRYEKLPLNGYEGLVKLLLNFIGQF